VAESPNFGMHVGMVQSATAGDETSRDPSHNMYCHLFENHHSGYKCHTAAAGCGQTW
jgi:hypothetical protein